MSGETWRPKNSQSSPTLETTVTSEKGWTARRPCSRRAAPTPPARTVIIGVVYSGQWIVDRSEPRTYKPRTCEPGRALRQALRLGSGRAGSLFPELAGKRHLADVLSQ